MVREGNKAGNYPKNGKRLDLHVSGGRVAGGLVHGYEGVVLLVGIQKLYHPLPHQLHECQLPCLDVLHRLSVSLGVRALAPGTGACCHNLGLLYGVGIGTHHAWRGQSL